MNEDVELNSLAQPGFSLLNEGALIAARRRKLSIDLDDAWEKISFGGERMYAEDRKIIAYHEAGCNNQAVDDGLLPIHKVTIIPRGQSLGSTMLTPKKDILNHSKEYTRSDLLCNGWSPLKKSKLVTPQVVQVISECTIARSMVCDWGMSDLGMISFGDKQDQVFLGKELSRAQNYSEETAQKIDIEIKLSSMTNISVLRIFPEKIDALHASAKLF